MKQDTLTRLKRFVTSTRTKLFVLMIVMIGLIVYFQWGAIHVYEWAGQGQRMEVRALSSQLEQTRQQLADYGSATPSVNETALDAANAYFDSQRTPIPGGVDINHVIKDVLTVAYQCGIKAIPLSTSEPSHLNVGGFGVLKWDFDLVTEGRFEDIAGFIGRIDGNEISGTIVKAVSIAPVLSGNGATDNITTDNVTVAMGSEAALARGDITVSVFSWDAGASDVVQ